MRAIILGKIQCCFCRGTDGILYSVHQYGIYGHASNKRHFFHMECLSLVESYPMNFGNALVDLALHINELLRDNKSKENDRIVARFEERFDKLEAMNFERMMPKKGLK